jgi:hypothetical protein
MYELTPRMIQSFRNYLVKFHELFGGGRCTAWQQEELIVKAIKSDTQAQHNVFWTEAGHDDRADIRVGTNRWKEDGKNYSQINRHDVVFSLRPSMSWQIWCTIPLPIIKRTNEIRIE